MYEHRGRNEKVNNLKISIGTKIKLRITNKIENFANNLRKSKLVDGETRH